MSNTTRFTGGFLIGSDSTIRADKSSQPLPPDSQYAYSIYIYDAEWEASLPTIYLGTDAARRLRDQLVALNIPDEFKP